MRKNKIIRPINSNSTITPNIIRGGKAIDLGNNMYYIAGRKHSNGGVDVGKDLEVEGGEVMQMKPNEVRVFSSVPFLRAGSPAKLVLGGANPDAVFNAQENFKDINRLNDDGTKYKCGGRKKAELGTEKQDNTSVTKPLIQEYFPAVGARKVYNDVKEILTKNGQIKPGNIEIVSPEFDLLTGIRGLTNMIIKDIPISKGSYYRVVGKDAIDDAKQVGIIRTPTEPKFDVQTLDRLSKDLKIPFNDIKNKTVEEIRELVRNSNLPPAKKLIRAKSNHGDVGFSKEGFFYKPNKNNYIIEGNENNSTFLQGHHGSYSGRFNKDINAGEPVVLREGENASNFTYWQNYPIIGWRNHKFKYGGGMNYIINGNVKNSLRHIRPKAKLGDWFRIDDTKYKIGDTFNYKGQSYIVNDRNEAVPVSTNLSKANPDAILNAITAAEWIKNNTFSPSIDLTNKQKSNNTKANNTETNNVAKSIQYTPNPDLVDIPQLNVGNSGTYFYNPKTTSTTAKRTVGSNAKSTNNLVKPIVDDTSLAVPYTQSDKISIPRYTEDVYKRPSLASMAKEIEDVDTINLARQYTKPNRFNRFTDWFNNNLDKINLYSNLGGSAIDFISSAIINSKMPTVDLPTMTAPTLANLPEIKLAEIKDLKAPVTVAAAKLKTRYNANPQLAKIEDETRRTMNEIDRNTSSSRVALARKQRAAIQSQEAKNQVYGQKENIETELMNKDRLNAQQVAQANAATYNQFLTARAQQAMQKAQLKMMVDRANIGNKLAVDQFNANSKLAVDQFNTNNLIKELLFNNNVRTTQLGNYAAGIGNLFSNIGGSLNNYMINRNARLRDEEVLRSLRARYKEIPQEIMDYILNK